jgi:hypothetical protein
MSQRVKGYCPMGCGETLFLGSGDYITCSYIDCPQPDAVSTLLDDREIQHIVDIGETTFTVRHPLRERLNDALLNCRLHNDIAAMSGPPAKPGRYRVSWDGAQTPPINWHWEAVANG